MAKKVLVTILCDYEKPGVEVEAEEDALRFGLGNATYEIDLCPKHRAKVEGDLQELAGRATRVGSAPSATRGGQGKKPLSRNRESRDRSKNIREWAKEMGHKVSDRGRVPEAIVAEYDATHPE
jgi:hypothetical protein